MAVGCTPGAGVDGPTNTVLACRVTPDPAGQQAAGLLARNACGPMTEARLAWSDWLAAGGVTPGAMERTGEDWRPVSHLRAGHVTIVLGHAAHVMPGPGRQTDKADARGLATRRREGRRPASVMPPHPPRDLRDLRRDRPTGVQERRRAVNRLQGGLARAPLTRAAVATDSLGVAGRARAWRPGCTAAPTRRRWRSWPKAGGGRRAPCGLRRQPG
jgi:hypothetical protein